MHYPDDDNSILLRHVSQILGDFPLCEENSTNQDNISNIPGEMSHEDDMHDIYLLRRRINNREHNLIK